MIPRDVTPNLRRSELGMERVAADLGEPAYPAPAFAGVDKFFSVTPYQSPGHVDAHVIGDIIACDEDAAARTSLRALGRSAADAAP